MIYWKPMFVLGIVAEIQNFLRITKINLWSNLATRGRREGKGGAPPLPPCPIRTRGRGGARPALAAPPLLHFRPMRPINPPGGFGNPPYSGFIRNFPGTLSVSEYSRPIYQSLCLDHFETPRYVRDHIWDSELTSVHQNS